MAELAVWQYMRQRENSDLHFASLKRILTAEDSRFRDTLPAPPNRRLPPFLRRRQSDPGLKDEVQPLLSLGSSDFARIVDLTKLRWRIERDYLELKQEVGLGHYEGATLARLSTSRQPVYRGYKIRIALRKTKSTGGSKRS